MNDYGVRTTVTEKANYPYNEYPFLQQTGTFNVTLKDKVWGKRVNIICAFETDSGLKFSISIFCRRRDEKYAPGSSAIDFALEPLGSKFTCSFIQTSSGFYKMSEAEYLM